MANPPPYPSTPRWVTVFGILAFAVILLFAILLFSRGSGGHGPGRHTRSGAAAPSTTPEQGR